MSFKYTLAAICLFLSPAAAHSVVIDFEDIDGFAVLPKGYGGIIWNDHWMNYDTPQYPYTPHSGVDRIYSHTNDENSHPFAFLDEVYFEGFWVSGFGVGEVSFDLYRNGTLLGSSTTSTVTTATPYFLASGYGGLIDEVRVKGVGGFFIADDITYRPGRGVPEPQSWAMLVAGLGIAGGALRRKRHQSGSIATNAPRSRSFMTRPARNTEPFIVI